MRGRRIRFLKKFLLSLFSSLLLPAALAAQAGDVVITAIGPIRDLARNVNWTNGQGGIGNTYIFSPAFPSENVSLYVTVYGPGSGPSTFTYSIAQTGDQNIRSYSQNCPAATCGASWTITTTGTATIATFGTTLVNFQAQGSASVAVVGSVSTISETASLYIVESSLTAKAGGSGASGYSNAFTAYAGSGTDTPAIGGTSGSAIFIAPVTVAGTPAFSTLSFGTNAFDSTNFWDFGMYAISGSGASVTATRLWHTGPIHLTGTDNLVVQALGGSFVLGPGTYLYAITQSSSGPLSGPYFGLSSPAPVVFATTATSTLGTLPSTMTVAVGPVTGSETTAYSPAFALN